MSTLYVNNILPDSGSNVFISGSLVISQSLTVTDDIILGGNINLGDANTDTITVVGEFTSSLIPDLDEIFDLGSTAKQWNRLVTKTITASNDISSSGTIYAANAKFDNFEITQQIFTTITASGGITASTFRGDGSNLTGIGVTGSSMHINNITASTDISASGTGSFNHFYVSGEISGAVSASGTGSFKGGIDCIGDADQQPASGAFGYVKSVGDVSASGTGSFAGGINSPLLTGSFGYISCSGDISSSGTGSFEHFIVTSEIGSNVSASGTGSFQGGVDCIGNGVMTPATGAFGMISCSGDISASGTGSFEHLVVTSQINSNVSASGTGSFMGGIDCIGGGTGMTPATGAFGYISASDGRYSASAGGWHYAGTTILSTGAELNTLDGFLGTADLLNALVYSGESDEIEADKFVKYTSGGEIKFKRPLEKTTKSLEPTASNAVLLPVTIRQTFTLPDPTGSAGAQFTFIAGHASAHIITSPTDKMQGIITDYTNGATVARTAVADKNSITLANAAIGDRLNFISDGTNWYVEGQLNDTPTLGTV